MRTILKCGCWIVLCALVTMGIRYFLPPFPATSYAIILGLAATLNGLNTYYIRQSLSKFDGAKIPPEFEKHRRDKFSAATKDKYQHMTEMEMLHRILSIITLTISALIVTPCCTNEQKLWLASTATGIFLVSLGLSIYLKQYHRLSREWLEALNHEADQIRRRKEDLKKMGIQS